jgi:hypothetical protein
MRRSIRRPHRIDDLPGPLHPRGGGFRVVSVGGRERADACIDAAAGGEGTADGCFHRSLAGTAPVRKVAGEQRSGMSGGQMIERHGDFLSCSVRDR